MLGDALGVSEDSSPLDNPSMVDEMRTSSHPLALEAYAPGWAVTKDSLFSEDIVAHEWSSCVHPSAMAKLVAGQLGARMADDLRYATAQAPALMVAAADRVCRSGINETMLKTL